MIEPEHLRELFPERDTGEKIALPISSRLCSSRWSNDLEDMVRKGCGPGVSRYYYLLLRLPIIARLVFIVKVIPL